MNIFPIGLIAAASSSGTISGLSYDLFEPNLRCSSSMVFSNLVTRFEQQSILSRKKAEPFLTLSYEYEDIFDKEFRQIESFIYNIAEGGNISFHVVDFSKGITPTAVTESSGDWVVSIPDTKLFSVNENIKSDRAFLWDGRNWKEGRVTSITTNTSITVDVDTSNYGALTVANAALGVVYPIYLCYIIGDALQAFKPTVFVKGNLNLTDVGGWMKSGTIAFATRYKV